AKLPSGSGQLLRPWYPVSGHRRAGRVAAKADAPLLLEAMGEAANATPEAPRARDRPGRGAHGEPQPERALEDESQQPRASGADRRMAVRPRGSRPCETMGRHSLSRRAERLNRDGMTNWNRPVRTRMPGGVGGDG